MELVKIEYELTESEYLAATRIYFFKSREVLIRTIVFCLFILLAALIIGVLTLELFPLWATFALATLFDIMVIYTMFIEAPRRYFRGDPKFRDKYELTFSDEGIKVKTHQIDSKLAWSLYTSVVEGRDFYLLIYGQQAAMMTTVPKRSFKDKQDENRFRELVSRHISDNSGLKQAPTEEPEYTPKSLTPPDWR